MENIELYKKTNEIIDSYYNLGISEKDIINYFNKGNTTVKSILKRINDVNITEEIVSDILRDRIAEYIDKN